MLLESEEGLNRGMTLKSLCGGVEQRHSIKSARLYQLLRHLSSGASNTFSRESMLQMKTQIMYN